MIEGGDYDSPSQKGHENVGFDAGCIETLCFGRRVS